METERKNNRREKQQERQRKRERESRRINKEEKKVGIPKVQHLPHLRYWVRRSSGSRAVMPVVVVAIANFTSTLFI